MRTPELGVVSVMVVVRALPDAAGAENQNPKDPHQAPGQAGMGQDRLMLLIVIYHEHPESEQPGENTADDFGGPMEIPKRPGKGNRQEKRCGKKMPPTTPRGIRGVWLRRQYEFYSCSHLRLVLPMFADCARFVDNNIAAAVKVNGSEWRLAKA